MDQGEQDMDALQQDTAKRRGTEEDDKNNTDRMAPPAKRTRGNSQDSVVVLPPPTTTGSTLGTGLDRPRRFLRLHLQLLQTLYSNNGNGNGNGRKKKEDGPVEEDIWDKIQYFLQDRSKMKTLNTQAKDCKGLLEEAVAVRDEDEQRSRDLEASMIMMPWSAVAASRHTTSSSFYAFRKAAAPPPLHTSHTSSLYTGKHSHHSPPYGYGVAGPPSMLYPSSAGAPGSIAGPHHHTTDGAGTAGPDAFGFLVGWFDEEYQSVLEELHETTKPFQPLLGAVATRIQSIHKVLAIIMINSSRAKAGEWNSDDKDTETPKNKASSTKINGDKGECIASNNSNNNNNNSKALSLGDCDPEEVQARLETKLQLWQLLEKDLLHNGEALSKP